ncbi:MAG: hypothetical protein EOM19_00975 [Candidatus Moranbacteria bacterium]|nr:hypothetical protein [Candidatus Moranbacteria bacterium]
MNYPEEITKFAKTNFRNREVTFGIKTDDRRRHMYIIGKTGMGKTNLLEHLAIQDIRNGHGIAYVDPHGDTSEKLIQMIPPERIQDVIYFNPSDQDFPISFNVMEKVDPAYRHLVASGLVGVFKKLWADSWGPRLEYILRNAILALLEHPGSTLLGVMRILVDKKFQKEVVASITDPVVRSFWVDEFTKWNERVLQEVIAPIQNKVGQFLSSSLIRNIVGQNESSFSIREAMDSRKILILNLSKGRIGEDNSALLGAMMITKIQLAAMARVDTPEQERKDFYLYVDEFQNFATESFANILSEARKYRLNLILANQYVNQIDEIVRDAIFGNAGTLISFRVGATDAEFLEKEFEPVFLQNDIINLPKYHIYLKLMIDGIAGDAFSAVTLAPVEGQEHEEVAEKVINFSREKYSFSRELVEENIRKWSGMEGLLFEKKALPTSAQARVFTKPSFEEKKVASYKTMEASAVRTSFQAQEKSNFTKQAIDEEHEKKEPFLEKRMILEEKKERILYDTVCEKCKESIKVPFKPDGSRPTFCREHLKEYQRETAKLQNPIASHGNNSGSKLLFVPKEKERIEVEAKFKTYTPGELPMNLSQMRFVAPKKFRPLSYSKPNSEEIRSLLKDIRGKNENSSQKNSSENTSLE